MPSITIVARSLDNRLGWKKKADYLKPDDMLAHQCKNFSSVEDCLDSETFPSHSFIKDTLLSCPLWIGQILGVQTSLTPLVVGHTNSIQNWWSGLQIVKLSPSTLDYTKFYYKIVAIQHIEKNVHGDPCVEDDQYSFTTCVKESLVKKVGCRPSWDV